MGRPQSWGRPAWGPQEVSRGWCGATERPRREMPGRSGARPPGARPVAPGWLGGAGRGPESRIGEPRPRATSLTRGLRALPLFGIRLSPGTSPRVIHQHGPFTSGTRPCAGTSGPPRHGLPRGGARSVVGPRPVERALPTTLSSASCVTSRRDWPAENDQAPLFPERRCGGEARKGREHRVRSVDPRATCQEVSPHPSTVC